MSFKKFEISQKEIKCLEGISQDDLKITEWEEKHLKEHSN